MVGLFCAATPAQLLLGAAFTLAVVVASHVPVGRVAASVRPLVLFLGVLSLFNLVFVQTGEVLLAAGPLTVTTGGAWAAVLYTIRFGLPHAGRAHPADHHTHAALGRLRPHDGAARPPGASPTRWPWCSALFSLCPPPDETRPSWTLSPCAAAGLTRAAPAAHPCHRPGGGGAAGQLPAPRRRALLRWTLGLLRGRRGDARTLHEQRPGRRAVAAVTLAFLAALVAGSGVPGGRG